MFDRFAICQLDRDFLNCIVAIDLMDAVELSVTLINAHRIAIGKASYTSTKLPLDMHHIIEKCDDIAWSMRNSDAQTRRAWILLGEFHANQDSPSVRKMLDMFTTTDKDDKGELCRLIERWGRH